MAKYRVTTEYRGRLGIPHKDVRVIEADGDDDRVKKTTAIADEIDCRYGRASVTGGSSKPI